MALTNFNNIYKLNPNEYAYTTTKHNVIKAGETIPLYVPKLMPKIDNGEPKISKLITKGSTVFKNSSTCKPTVKKVLNNQNYITPKLSNNKSWEGISKKKQIGEDKYIEYIDRKTTVTCTSLNKGIKEMNFSTDHKY